jgi:hypothetical protein
MAINVYESEQRISFGEKAAVYLGWHLTNANTGMSVHPFVDSADRARFITTVEKALPADKLQDAERIAAFLAFSEWGESEDDRSWGNDLLGPDEDEIVVEELLELAAEYELATTRSEGPPGARELATAIEGFDPKVQERMTVALDEEVHTALSDRAADINKSGWAQQILFLLESGWKRGYLATCLAKAAEEMGARDVARALQVLAEGWDQTSAVTAVTREPATAGHTMQDLADRLTPPAANRGRTR